LAKAQHFDADVLIIDLQDSVPWEEGAKALARAQAAQFLDAGDHQAREITLRINGPASPWIIEDVRLAVAHRTDSITVPEVVKLKDLLFVEALVDHFSQALGVTGPAMLLEVETPGLLCDLETIATHTERVNGLCVAPFDYALNTEAKLPLLGQPGALGDAHLSWLRPKVVAIARAHGWTATDAVMLQDPRDASLLSAAIERSRQTGFDGSAVLHPSHLPKVNAGFSPTEAELNAARQMLASATPLRQQRALAQRLLQLKDQIDLPRPTRPDTTHQ
jgi:citrate lyase subunit beta/citryl-CoA lyase